MRTEKKRMAIILGIIVLLLLCAVVPAFALLIHDTNIDFNTQFGEIPADAIDFSAQSHQTFIFTHAGESKDINLNVLNKADKPMHYSYEIVVASDSQGLENAIFVYFDNEFRGSLASAKVLPIEITNDDYLLNAKLGEIQDGANHQLTFQLHNGADGSIYQNKEFKVIVTMRAKTINYQDNIMVSSIDEFTKAMVDVQYSTRRKTIRLTADIMLNRDATLTAACDIDLMGHSLKFNGNLLNFAFTEVGGARIFSSRNAATNTETRGLAMINDKTSLEFGKGATSYHTAVSIVACDMAEAERMVAADINSTLVKGIMTGSNVTVAGGLLHYIKANKVDIAKQDGDYNLTGQTIVTAASYRTSIATIKVGNTNIEFKLLGQDTDGYTAIINQKFAYLDMLSIGNSSVDVDFDLYLPNKFEDINATITWQSLNPNILSDKGICGDSVEGLATLIATVHINGDTIIKSMTFSILKQSNQMRFDYLVARIGEQSLSALYDTSMPSGSYFTLPIVKQDNAEDYRMMYSLRSLGLESLTYELSPTFNYLSMLGTNNRVHLVEPTLESFAEILIKGKFSNEQDKEYISSIGVQIKTLDNTKLHKQILDYIQTLLNKVDILQNVLDTRAKFGMASERGDFTLPSEYKGFDLTYTSVDPLFKAIELIAPTDDTEGQYVFELDLSKLASKSGAAVIQASIRIKNAEAESLTTQSPMKVNTPAAIVMAADGIADAALFNSIKIQTIQQLIADNGVLLQGVPTISQTVEGDSLLLNGYILMHDVAWVKKLIIRTGEYSYGNAVQKHEYDANAALYYYSVNDLAQVYYGLGLFNNLTYLAVNNNAQLFKGTVLAASQLSSALLDMIASEYKNLTHLELTNASLTTAVQTLKLSSLTHLELQGNTGIANMEFLCERMSNTLNYLDISNTGYDYNADYGILASMYYRHTILGGNQPPEWYYTNGSTRTRYLYNETASWLEAYFYIYTLALAKDTITSMAVQLKWDILSKNLGQLKLLWSVAPNTNHAGLSIGVIEIDAISSKVKLINNMLGTTPPAGGKKNEDCRLIAAVTFKDLQTNTDRTINRTFKLKLFY